MSQIKLSPNASGTGDFTIASPNGNTNRTLTLPDATGTFNTSGAVNEVPAGSVSAPSIYPTGDTNTGIFFPAADTIAFAEGGAEAMRINSSGNLGIGTTSPAAPLTIVRDHVSSNGTLKIQTVTSFASGGLSSIDLSDSDGTRKGFVYQDSTGFALETASSLPITFRAGGGERGRFTSGGKFYVGCTSDPSSSTLGIALVKDAPNNQAYFMTSRTSTADGEHWYIYNSNGLVGSVKTSGSATSFNTSSDYRLKENIAPMTGALAAVTQLKPSTWTWKVDGTAGQGFIAHELAEVLPDCVTGEKDAVETYVDEEGVEQTRPKYQGVDTSFLVATLTAAIQELKAELDEAKARIATLEAK